MGFIKKILGEFKETAIQIIDDSEELEREQLMGELCEHLQQIGVKGTLLDPSSPEGFRFPPFVLGCVKIEGRNVDVILVQSTNIWYNYYYVVRADVDGLEGKLRADFRSDWRDRCCLKRDFKLVDESLITQEVSGAHWEGGELAQLLNADSDLAYTLYSEGLDRLEIRPDRGRRCVKILHPHQRRKVYSKRDMGPGDIEYTVGDESRFTIGRKQFPTREAFEAYDRGAYSIKKVVKAGFQ
jgi:hypothetical protein